MSHYDDMREMQRMEEQGDDYVPSTIAYTQADRAELIHDCGDDEDMARHIMGEVMSRDMANRDRAVEQKLDSYRRRITALEEALADAGIDPSEID